jgi:outer membrane biosynthesis protein TonB
MGGFSLNTYQWDFAPYMLWLKNHVQRNIFPPAAFTRMGIISGNTVLRFRISRDGVLQGMELAGYEGHKSLMETSVRAIQLSAPFRALPKDFPEDYLEVTAHFEYTIRK